VLQERLDGQAGQAESESEHSLIPIGYWHSEEGDGLPHPQTMVSWTWENRNWAFWHEWSRAQGRFEYEPNCWACQVTREGRLDGVLAETGAKAVSARAGVAGAATAIAAGRGTLPLRLEHDGRVHS
jgi:hypothetical protein